MADAPTEVTHVSEPTVESENIGGKTKPRFPKSPRVKIEVTEDHIGLAIPRDSGHCMIADAVKAAVPTAKSISVDLQTIRWTDPKTRTRHTYLTPRVGQVALVKFDQGLKVEPFCFQLRSGQVTRSGRGSSRKGKHKNESTKTTLGNNHGGREVPRRVGGKTPPLAAHHSKRRAFGLRAMEL